MSDLALLDAVASFERMMRIMFGPHAWCLESPRSHYRGADAAILHCTIPAPNQKAPDATVVPPLRGRDLYLYFVELRQLREQQRRARLSDPTLPLPRRWR